MLEGRAPLDDTRLALLLNSATLPAASWRITLGPQPRLSFSLARQEWSSVEGSELTISVDQQVVATEPAPKDGRMEQWRQIDVDLTAWSGKTVTLSLEVHARKPVKLLVADPVIYARVPADRQIAAEPEDVRIFDTRTSPVAVSFSPPAVRAGQSYSMSLPAAEWAGQWVDVLITTGDAEPVEVPHFQQLDRKGQVRVAVDPSFYPCEIQVRGVRRSGDTSWQAAAGSIVVKSATTR